MEVDEMGDGFFFKIFKSKSIETIYSNQFQLW